MTLTRCIIWLLVAALASSCSPSSPPPPTPQVASNAPTDRPLGVTDTNGARRLQEILERCTKRARATYPAARDRYLRGLPANQSFFVSVKLQDIDGRFEQVFLAVDEIRSDTVKGRIWNELRVVRGFRLGQVLTIPESEVRDWTITRSDGTEEGNYAGSAVDAIEAGREPSC